MGSSLRAFWISLPLQALFIACLNDAPTLPEANTLPGGDPGVPDTLPSNWRAHAASAAEGKTLHEVARGDSGFVVRVGDNSLIFSADGKTWAATPPLGAVYGIAWGGKPGEERYVAVGNSGMWISENGKTWALDNPAFFDSARMFLSGIAWNGSTFVLAGVSVRMDAQSGVLRVFSPHLWSAGGLDGWVEATYPAPVLNVPPGTSVGGLTWDVEKGVFVARSYRITLLSADGKSWIYENEAP